MNNETQSHDVNRRTAFAMAASFSVLANLLDSSTQAQEENSNSELVAEIEAELADLDINEINIEEKEVLVLEQQINQLMVDMSIEGVEHKEDTVTYISSIEKYEDMITIFRGALKIHYNLIPFFQRLSKPFLSEQYASIDIIATLIQKIVKDTEMTAGLKKYILTQIVSFMNYKEE